MSRLKLAVAAGIVIFAASGTGAGAAAHHAASALAKGEAAANSSVATGQSLADRYGWGPHTSAVQWQCLYTLWEHESDWSATAANPASNARGIPQNIAGWSAGYPYGDAAAQIAWGLNYIRGRYGNPCAALAFWQARSPHWY